MGFSYHGPDGEVLADEVTFERIKNLVIPPAWKKVWISPYPNGHIQVVGTESYGLATLQCEHVTLRREAVSFDHPAKNGVRRTLDVEEAEVARAVRALLRRADRTERLLLCRNASGWVDIRADDLNARFKELVGDDYSVKDLRTWHGTVLAAEAFVDADPPESKRAIKRVESAVMKEVAEGLGNTPAVARGSYVDPRVVCRLRAGPDHREGGTAGRTNPQARGGTSHPEEGHPQPDPSSRQGLIRIVASTPEARPIRAGPPSDADQLLIGLLAFLGSLGGAAG